MNKSELLKQVLNCISEYIGYDCEDILSDIYNIARKKKDKQLLELFREYKSLGGVL